MTTIFHITSPPPPPPPFPNPPPTKLAYLKSVVDLLLYQLISVILIQQSRTSDKILERMCAVIAYKLAPAVAVLFK